MGSVLVTGAAGFVGSHVCEALLARGEQVVGLDNFDPYYDPRVKRRHIAALSKQPGFTGLEADVRDAGAVKNAVEQYRVDRVLHLAALAGVRASIDRAADYTAVNVIGTVNVLDAARSARAKVVVISTSSVYGSAARIPFAEEDAADRPLAPYPASKRAAEIMAYSYYNLFDMPINVLRLFSVYGPRGRPDMMPFQIADGIVRGRAVTLFNHGQMHRDWTYISDITDGIIRALDGLRSGFNVYNLGRGEPVLMADFVRLLEGMIGRPAVIHDAPAPASEPPRTFADIRRARTDFGYRPTVSVAEGLAQFWEWFRQTPPEP